MSQAIKELTSVFDTSKAMSTSDRHLIEACEIFRDCVTEFGRKISAMDSLYPEEDAESLQASARQLCAEWQSIAWNIIETPAHSSFATEAKTEALSAYFLNVGSAIECIGVDLAKSLVADLKRGRNP